MYLYGVRESNYLFIVGRELCTDHPSTATSTRTRYISHSDIIEVIYLKGIVHCLSMLCNTLTVSAESSCPTAAIDPSSFKQQNRERLFPLGET